MNADLKVSYWNAEGYESTAYVHEPEPVRNLENENGSPATDYPRIACGVNKHSDEPVALQWTRGGWVQLVLPEGTSLIRHAR